MVTGPVEEYILSRQRTRVKIYGCGPEGMLKATNDLGVRLGVGGQISLEAPMPCGVGVCLGCIKPTLADPRKYVRVCYDGPVFKLGEVKI